MDNQYGYETVETNKQADYNFGTQSTKPVEKYDSNNIYAPNPATGYTYPPFAPNNSQPVNQSYDSKRFSTSKKAASPNKTSGTNRTRTPDRADKKHNSDYPQE
jgi:hypothetical protein